MRFDLKKPCKNCPFGIGPERITFRARERAEEIEEQAYRQGFPCHLSADLDDGDEEDYGSGGYVFGDKTQHCAGALAMHINDGFDSTPGTNNNTRLFERLAQRLDLSAAFESVDTFLEANTAPGEA